MIRKLLMFVFLILFSSQAVSASDSFIELESKVYDVNQLASLGTNYDTYSKYTTELALSLGRYDRTLNGYEPSAYEFNIRKAAQEYVEIMQYWAKSISTPQNDPDTFRVIIKVKFAIANHTILTAKKIK